MNSLYTLGVRQSSAIQADLERLRGGDTSASLLGIFPSLLSMSVWVPSAQSVRADIRLTCRDEPHNRRL